MYGIIADRSKYHPTGIGISWSLNKDSNKNNVRLTRTSTLHLWMPQISYLI